MELTTRQKISKALLGRKPWNKGLTAETDPRVIALSHKSWNLGKHMSEESKKKLSESRKGIKPWNTGRHWPEKFKPMLSECHKGQVSWSKGLTKEEHPSLMRTSQAHKGRQFSPEHRLHISQACKGKKAWNKGIKRPWLSELNRNPEFMQKRMKGLFKRPSKPERDLIAILGKHHLPFKYSGDGAIIINGLNPDFIHTGEEKRIIEVFGRTYHDTRSAFADVPIIQQEIPRKAIYAKKGYSCLIIWDDELKEPQVLAKIGEFMNNGNIT